MPCLLKTIQQSNREYEEMVEELAKAPTLALMIIIAWRLARKIAVGLVEEVLAKRAESKTEWCVCEKCGKRLESKGFAGRQIKSVIGIIKWRRRVGRCPNKCAIGQVAPLDEAMGLQPNQKSDSGLQQMACLAAIFVPFETAAMLLGQLKRKDALVMARQQPAYIVIAWRLSWVILTSYPSVCGWRLSNKG